MMFSEQVYRFRKEAKMTQEDLAEKCEVSRQAVAKWESGESIPDIYKIMQIARLFDISLDELVRGEKQHESQKELARKIYLLFSTNMENHTIYMRGGGSYYKIDHQRSDEALLKNLRSVIRQARTVFPKKIIDELLFLTEDCYLYYNTIFSKEYYKGILEGNKEEKLKKYCEYIIPEKYDRIEEILKDYLDLP